MRLAREHDVGTAPFFIVERGATDRGATPVCSSCSYERFTSAPAPRRARGGPARPWRAPTSPGSRTSSSSARRRRSCAGRSSASAQDCALAFSGAEDVVLIDMAAQTGLPFSVFCLDTGRLHPETYRFIDQVRKHYGIEIELMSPEPDALQPFVRKKGLFSFYEDGH